jgi:ATP-dependent RNA helicase DeaD
MNKFDKYGLSKNLLEAIKKMRIDVPTPIQDKTILPIMEGKDVIGESATGSGKTLAFGCGIVDHIVPGRELQALVLTPTRELAEQVSVSLKTISDKKPLNIITVYGGVSIDNQITNLQSANVVVATPGRLLDHIKRRTINISKVKLLVLDEADRMLDMGFIDDVERIIRSCPKERQTLFFSATISPRIYTLSKRHMKTPVRVSVVKHVDPTKLTQIYYDVSKNVKLSLLVHLLRNEKAGLVMVFCNTRNTVDFVVKNLKANDVDAIAIHGGLTQNKRSKTLDSFNKGKVGVLVCTDVAARGLHIDNVSHVYNYEIPNDSNDYVHRIGRTARAGSDGKVINLICRYDFDNFSRVMGAYRNFKVDKIDLPEIGRILPVLSEKRERRPSFNRMRGRSGNRPRGGSFGRRR